MKILLSLVHLSASLMKSSCCFVYFSFIFYSICNALSINAHNYNDEGIFQLRMELEKNNDTTQHTMKEKRTV